MVTGKSVPPEYIFIHCSDSPWGEVLEINQWHLARNFAGIGYHYVILNGLPYAKSVYSAFLDGVIEPGRKLFNPPMMQKDTYGEHVKKFNGISYNTTSVGICLVGRTFFTAKQLNSMKELVSIISASANIPISKVLGHYEAAGSGKTCPNMPMDKVRSFLTGDLSVDRLHTEIVVHIASLAIK